MPSKNRWIYLSFLCLKNLKKKIQNKTKQNKTKQNKTKQNKTKQNKTKQNKTKGKKISYLSLPWEHVRAFAIETAGSHFWSRDGEATIWTRIPEMKSNIFISIDL